MIEKLLGNLSLWSQGTCWLAGILALALTSGVSAEPPEPRRERWELVFADEFEGSDLDLRKWTPNWLNNDPHAITPPVQPGYETAAYDPAQVSVSDGVLLLKAVASPATVNGGYYPNRSGMVQTEDKFAFTFGVVEARIYLSGTRGIISNWPAFWLNGERNPQDGEIDILEGLRGRAAWHFHNASDSVGGFPRGHYTGWHVYRVEWGPGRLDYWYDGKLVSRVTSGVTASPLYIVMNLAIGGGGGPRELPGMMMVDYVRVWQRR